MAENKNPQVELMLALLAIKEQFPEMKEFISMQAALVRHAHQALVQEGFTNHEALVIVKERGYLLDKF